MMYPIKRKLVLILPAMLLAMLGLLFACSSQKPAAQTLTAPQSAVTPAPSSEAVYPLTPRPRLKVATTTSLYDTGLWGYLEPMFEKRYGVELDVLYAGSGKALELGMRGDVDVVTIHSKADEEKFVAEGYGVKRIPFAYNYFLVVGPTSDPAAIKGLTPEAAFRKLIEKGKASPDVKFVSRGDNSGTHVMEKNFWKAIGYQYDDIRKSESWYIEAGNGMGPTLVMASEKSAYTLTDIGTFLAFKGQLSLVPIVDKGESLLNVYSVIAVNPAKVKGVNAKMAASMVDFLTSKEIQELIGKYGVKQYGRQLFTPAAGQNL